MNKTWRIQDASGKDLCMHDCLHEKDAHEQAIKYAKELEGSIGVWELVAVYRKGEAPIEKVPLTQVPECKLDKPETSTVSTCQKKLMQEGKAHPRTCPICGISGKCHFGL